ncbi:replication/maintenance protein RepL [Hydrogenimonas thermophila]|uniref:Replication protein (RepL) n=1 Tax=Hydrogenimonas thermophila TaxID=223786 RepID=A0A1I5UWL7_9BACT|nr:replication/maintenance protein RepL [Hydrogenimonas thermophila]SFP99655.1 replication protein (RepL) [Hydrogenimonas thermophila]
MADTTSLVYEREREIVDNQTGEVLKTEQDRIIKVSKTPDFVMMFTENLGALMRLTKSEISVLSVILQRYVMRGNAVVLDTKIRKLIVEAAELKSLSTLRTILYNLKKKQIFLENETDGLLYINPYLFGKGSWNEIRKLRQEFIWEWDFEKNEVKQITGTAATYEDAEAIKNMQIIDAKEEKNGNKIERTILVEEAEEEQKTKGLGRLKAILEKKKNASSKEVEQKMKLIGIANGKIGDIDVKEEYRKHLEEKYGEA